MLRLLRLWFLQGSHSRGLSSQNRSSRNRRARQPWQKHLLIWVLCLVGIGTGVALIPTLAKAQSGVQQAEDQVIRQFSLPRPTAQPPVYRPRPAAPARSSSDSAPDQRSRSVSPEAPRSAPRRETAPVAPAPARRSSPLPAPTAPPIHSNPSPPESETRTTETARSTPSNQYQYELEFNRSPVVGNRLRLQGVYAQTQLGFTRPRNWQVQSAKALIRFQHSPTLLADRSHLMVRINDTSIGSVPLDRQKSEVGQVLFNIPANLIQDYNNISLLAEQQTSDTCTNPADPTLWSEILPDSKVMINFQPQPIALDFSRYPYPFFDDLSLDPNQISYLRPKTYSEAWLTATSRLQTTMGRLADFRPLNTRLVVGSDQLEGNDRLVVIGTPTEQPTLADLSLPFPLANGQFLDGDNSPLPGNVGVLMLTTIQDSGVPVLVATGNAAEGVSKAVQFLVQSKNRQIGTGQAVVVNTLADVPSPAPRQWAGYLPIANSFRLSDLTTPSRQPFEDVTVRGSNPPPVQIAFHALPDDRFSRGSTMTLRYSYSPQVDPRTSAVEVRIDNVTIGSKRLTSGGKESFNVSLPENLVRPDSVIDVQFVLKSREAATCGLTTDQQLWGTVHSDTSFDLKRDNVVKLPDLKLLKAGYPLTAPQDLSSTAIALPDSPTDTDVNTLLALSKRMGRLSQAETVALQVYRTGSLPAEVRNQQHLVGIGTRDRFPFPEVFDGKGGFDLRNTFGRQWQQSQIQTLVDSEGVSKEILSPWNRDRTLLALTGQTEQGLKEIQALFERDPLFSQLRGDTALIRRNQQTQNLYDPDAYSLEFLEQAPQRQIERIGLLSRISLFLQDNWFMIPTGIVLVALLLYGFSQLYVNRVAKAGDVK
jgi:cellulose synthase operon protein B